jgi:hypothetical protein
MKLEMLQQPRAWSKAAFHDRVLVSTKTPVSPFLEIAADQS